MVTRVHPISAAGAAYRVSLDAPSFKELQAHPLFEFTDPAQVGTFHDNLIREIERPTFPDDYNRFVRLCFNEDWFQQFYTEDTTPEILTAVAWMAHTKGKINSDELVNVCTIAGVLKEGTNPQIFTLGSERDAVKAFNRTRMPLFQAPYLEAPVALEARNEFIRSFFALAPSPLVRTVATYTITPFLAPEDRLEDSSPITIEEGIYFSGGKSIPRAMGTCDDRSGGKRIHLFPAPLLQELYRLSKRDQAPLKYSMRPMIGYTADGYRPFSRHRMFSVPCPLLPPPPYVHGYRAGAPSLGLVFHDLYYHSLIDYHNPFVEDFVAFGIQFHAKAALDPERAADWEQVSLQFLDRECPHFLLGDPLQHTVYYLAAICDELKDSQLPFARDFVLPLIGDALLSHRGAKDRALFLYQIAMAYWFLVQQKATPQEIELAQALFVYCLEKGKSPRFSERDAIELVKSIQIQEKIEETPLTHRSDFILMLGALIPEALMDRPEFAFFRACLIDASAAK